MYEYYALLAEKLKVNYFRKYGIKPNAILLPKYMYDAIVKEFKELDILDGEIKTWLGMEVIACDYEDVARVFTKIN
jgi:hypothetical protein